MLCESSSLSDSVTVSLECKNYDVANSTPKKAEAEELSWCLGARSVQRTQFSLRNRRLPSRKKCSFQSSKALIPMLRSLHQQWRVLATCLQSARSKVINAIKTLHLRKGGKDAQAISSIKSIVDGCSYTNTSLRFCNGCMWEKWKDKTHCVLTETDTHDANIDYVSIAYTNNAHFHKILFKNLVDWWGSSCILSSHFSVSISAHFHKRRRINTVASIAITSWYGHQSHRQLFHSEGCHCLLHLLVVAGMMWRLQ